MAGNKIDFIKRYKELVEKVEKGEIAIGDACYEIGRGMAVRTLRIDPKLEGIMREAEEFESSPKETQGSREERWAKLKNKIESLR
ncbi:hypothetical protein A2524_02430 [Candidatus Wolfebacteria bacterium RIFOXYD12_FULL_48_21]|nr:MAG: hypothetical protein A2524_02430 [Candidatus Wolfebacteria bacterium RIFOXYD12_FULL_48_21]OGM95717.1 MAG: hypothetical protein A2532_03680 [Candidatus Wolfebacteria bacterium RIFOXYD2_FULL_48_11]